MMLHRHILFSAESAAHQFVDNPDFFAWKPKHFGTFVLGCISSLICGIDQYAVLIRHGNRTFRLQKCMFRPWCMKLLGIDIFCIGNGFLGISSGYMLVCQQVSASVYLRRILFHGLIRTADKRQLLVFDFHQFFRFFHHIQVLANHKCNGISQIMRNGTNRNHSIPVLNQMSDFHISRNIRSSKDIYDTRNGFCFFCIDGQHPCSRIFGTDRTRVKQSFHFHVIHVLSIS